MKKHGFRILLVVLIVILAIVSFYMLWVHVPYYQHYHGLDEIRNEICETNHYEYMDYLLKYQESSPSHTLGCRGDNDMHNRLVLFLKRWKSFG